MKKLSKLLSIVLALVLCAGMVTPAFAATFTDLQNAIDGTEDGTLIEGSDRYGYAWNAETSNYGIEAWDDGDTRNVQLNEDVTRDNTDANTQNAETNRSSITISAGNTVELDLNGCKIDRNSNGISAAGSTIWVRGTLTLNDSSEEGTGTITGANQSGVWVDGTFTMNGGTISGNSANSGTINGGNNNSGGGVHVSGGTFTMTGGTITANETTNAGASDGGGGVAVTDGGTFTMTGGTISGNTSAANGGGVLVTGKNSTFEMNGGTIEGNTTTGAWGEDGAVIYGGAMTIGSEDGECGYIAGDVYVKENGTVTVDVDGNAAVTVEGESKTIAGLLQRDVDTSNKSNRINGNYDESPEPTDEVTSVGIQHFVKISYVDAPDNGSGAEIADPEVPLAGLPGEDGALTDIGDAAVPLADGPVTRAEFIDYLWRHEGEPETDGVCTFTDVPEDHPYVLALAWAEQTGVAEAYEDGAFEPDELITVGAAREFLGNFARVFGMDVDVYALTSLTGGDDEAVLNCGEVIAEFFGEAEAIAA